MSTDSSPRPRLLPSAEVGLATNEPATLASWLRMSRWSIMRIDAWDFKPIALLLVLLSICIYLPFLNLPLLPDDYLQVTLARKYGAVSSWGALAEDPLYRSRATSLLLTYWTDNVFGFSRLAFGIS